MTAFIVNKWAKSVESETSDDASNIFGAAIVGSERFRPQCDLLATRDQSFLTIFSPDSRITPLPDLTRKQNGKLYYI